MGIRNSGPIGGRATFSAPRRQYPRPSWQNRRRRGPRHNRRAGDRTYAVLHRTTRGPSGPAELPRRPAVASQNAHLAYLRALLTALMPPLAAAIVSHPIRGHPGFRPLISARPPLQSSPFSSPSHGPALSSVATHHLQSARSCTISGTLQRGVLVLGGLFFAALAPNLSPSLITMPAARREFVHTGPLDPSRFTPNATLHSTPRLPPEHHRSTPWLYPPSSNRPRGTRRSSHHGHRPTVTHARCCDVSLPSHTTCSPHDQWHTPTRSSF